MKMTLKQNINTNSLVLRHRILVQATGLVMGREGALETEQDLFLMLSFIDNIIEENLVEECNEDERDLITIMETEVEPFFFEIMKQEKYKEMWDYVNKIFIDKCKEIWANQHSIIGVIDTILEVLGTMDETQKGEILKSTAKIAEAAQEKRTAIMAEKADQANSKLEELVKSYQRAEAQKLEQEEIKEDDAE